MRIKTEAWKEQYRKEQAEYRAEKEKKKKKREEIKNGARKAEKISLADEFGHNKLGNTIKQRRKQMRMSQEELADEVGVGVRTISNMENGGNTDALTLFCIVTVLQLPWIVLDKMTENGRMDFAAELGDIIKKHRKQKLLTQEELSVKARLSLKTIRRVESGSNVDVLTLGRLAEVLDLPWLLPDAMEENSKK